MKLSFENVSKSYGKTRALTDFTLELEPGIYALLGPNGSGKSTLMNIITDNLKADEGTIFFEDENTAKDNVLSLGVRFRSLLGYMPQYPGMYGNFSVSDFLWYMAALKDVASDRKRRERKKAVAEEIRELLEAVELTEVSAKKISTLSGGMKQRLGLAQALLGSPSIVILDEPTAGLDPKQRIAVRNLISKIALNKIVLIATHVVSDVEFIAKKAILLKKGKIVAFDSPARLSESIRGKVLTVSLPEERLEEFGKEYPVIGMTACGDRLRLRFLADTPPEGAEAVDTPTLEDYYLHTFREEIDALPT